ncbi:MAG: RidA family protein [Magnetococcales bacterium]|nr:RidA family protein [Magnetococcales bacterium]MBF0321545.1 RidA family protein [Magnetococcales bacterium]
MVTVIQTKEAPPAIGPYSQAIRCGEWLFLSGQIPLDPRTGNIVPGQAREQTEQVLRNLTAILTAAGCGLASVVKTTVFLVDLADFPDVNAVYQEFFKPPFPARATVQVAALPRGARVEIEAVAKAGAS